MSQMGSEHRCLPPHGATLSLLIHIPSLHKAVTPILSKADHLEGLNTKAGSLENIHLHFFPGTFSLLGVKPETVLVEFRVAAPMGWSDVLFLLVGTMREACE